MIDRIGYIKVYINHPPWYYTIERNTPGFRNRAMSQVDWILYLLDQPATQAYFSSATVPQ
mgnify:FL=1